MASENSNTNRRSVISLLGFGEAATAFVTGWREDNPDTVFKAYDIKTDNVDSAVRDGKRRDYAQHEVVGCSSLAEAVEGSSLVFSLVTADQAYAAAGNAAKFLEPSTFFFDCNSCAPGTKQRSAELLMKSGIRYVDAAVMSPVHPKLHKSPILVSGSHAKDGLEILNELGMAATLVEGEIGRASSIKMIRSIMVKGLEALVAECVLAGHKAGVDDVVLESLEKTYPGFCWKDRAGYMFERMIVHGKRRAAEMREVAITIDDLGLNNGMARAIVDWQQSIGDLEIPAADIENMDFSARAETILQGLGSTGDPKNKDI